MNKHICEYCNEEFKKKRVWYEHEIVCELLHKVNKDDENELDINLNSNDIYKILIQIAKKQHELEKDLKELKRQTVIKINILDWINKNLIPKTSFSNFTKLMSKMNFSMRYLLEESIQEILKYVIINNLNLYKIQNNNYLEWPVFSYKNKLYCYDFTSKKWSEENNLCEEIYLLWSNETINLLNTWKEQNFKTIDEYIEKKYHLTILNLVDDVKEKLFVKTIKSTLIENIKSNINTISYQII